MAAALGDILDEAVSIAPLPSARFDLTMRVRRARPATLRDLLLLATVRYLYERVVAAKRFEPGVVHGGRDLFPELPLSADDSALLALVATPKEGRG